MHKITKVTELQVNWLYHITSKFYGLDGLYYYEGQSSFRDYTVWFTEKCTDGYGKRNLGMSYTPIRKKLKWFKDTRILPTLDFKLTEEL